MTEAEVSNWSSTNFWLCIVGLQVTSTMLGWTMKSLQKSGKTNKSSSYGNDSGTDINYVTVLQDNSGVWLRPIGGSDCDVVTNQVLHQHHSIVNSLYILCVAPVLEELVFRLIPYWSRAPPSLAMLIAGPIFGLCHLINYRVFNKQLVGGGGLVSAPTMMALNQAVNTNFLGLILYLTLQRYQRSYIPILVHSTNNFLAYLTTTR